jgi:hypothetical protein
MSAYKTNVIFLSMPNVYASSSSKRLLLSGASMQVKLRPLWSKHVQEHSK